MLKLHHLTHSDSDTPTAKARWVLIYVNFQIHSKVHKTDFLSMILSLSITPMSELAITFGSCQNRFIKFYTPILLNVVILLNLCISIS